jgi:hypothetical protein
MDLDHARRLLSEIPDGARVVDVGGGAAAFPRADHVIDALPIESAGLGSNGNSHRALGVAPRYNRERWTQLDLCDHRPWPFADKAFDFAVCSHLLEDVRDPIWICSELRRIARAGYIEVPSRVQEQSKGVENPRHAGYWHHRWLVEKHGGGLRFRHKPHVLHSVNDAIVTHLSPGWRINPRHASIALDWKDGFDADEALEFDEGNAIQELCDFARAARRLPDLAVRTPMPLADRIRRHMFYRRLARGRRF